MQLYLLDLTTSALHFHQNCFYLSSVISRQIEDLIIVLFYSLKRQSEAMCQNIALNQETIIWKSWIKEGRLT